VPILQWGLLLDKCYHIESADAASVRQLKGIRWIIYLTHSLTFTRSARSARQHKAWGEASAASETPGPRQRNETSRRSGRQPLTRILKCWEQFWHGPSPAPRARLIVPDMILGFRPDESGLHPRLYATARSAGFVRQVDNLREMFMATRSAFRSRGRSEKVVRF